jgi:hypothetical protein
MATDETGQTPNLMRKRAYARYRGRSPASVSGWIRRGWIVLEGGLVDVARSDALLDANLDPGLGVRAGSPPEKRGRPTGPPSSLAVAAAADRAAAVRLKNLRLDIEVEGLLDAAAANRGARKAQAVVEAHLRDLPARIGAALAKRFNVDPKQAIALFAQEAEMILKDLGARLDEHIAEFTPRNAATSGN